MLFTEFNLEDAKKVWQEEAALSKSQHPLYSHSYHETARSSLITIQ